MPKLYGYCHYSKYVFACVGMAVVLILTGMPEKVVAQSSDRQTFLEEVVVTARRKEESLQESPVAVTALSAEALEVRNIQSVSEVTNYAPNIQFDSAASESGGGSSSQISIRGIGQTDYTITVEPGVGLYLDGVYIGKSVGSLVDTVDLESIQVLRGPQGTLFGKNTIGGAVLLTSKKPNDDLGLSVDVTGGDFARHDFKASANIPVSDALRVRASLASLNRDGHVDRILTGETQGNKKASTARIVAEFDISDDLLATFAIDGTTTDEESPGQVLVAVDESPASAFASAHNGANPGCVAPNPERLTNPNCVNSQFVREIDSLESTNTGPNQSDADTWGTSLTFDWSVTEDAALKSITAFRRADVDVFQELSGIPSYLNIIAQDITLEQFSQEFQLSGDAFDNRLSYVAGLYYGTEEGSQVFPVLLESVEFTTGGLIDNESQAIFGQLTYSITDLLAVTLGARYSDETKRFNPKQSVDRVNPDFQALFDGLDEFAMTLGQRFLVREGDAILPDVEVERMDEEFTPSITFDYQVTDNFLAYAIYSEGFKGGGFTMRGFPPIIPNVTTTETDPNRIIPSFDPETSEVFELGFKSELLDNRIRLNAAVFSTDYKNVQLTANAGVSAFVPILINAGDASIEGLEIESEISAANWLRLNFSIGYLNSEYTKLSEAALNTPGITIDNELPNSPEWSSSIGFTADLLNNNNGHLYWRTDISYRSSQYKTVANEEFLKQGSYALINTAATYEFLRTGWKAIAGVSNLTDEIYIVSGVFNQGIGYGQAVVSRPREVFVSVKYEI